MHTSAAAGVVEEKRSANLEGFVETDAMPRRNRSRSDPSQISDRPPNILGARGIAFELRPWPVKAVALNEVLDSHGIILLEFCFQAINC